MTLAEKTFGWGLMLLGVFLSVYVGKTVGLICGIVGLILVIHSQLFAKRKTDPQSLPSQNTANVSDTAKVQNSGNATVTQHFNFPPTAPAPPLTTAIPIPEQEPEAELQFVSDKVTGIVYDRARYITDDAQIPNGVSAIFQNKLKSKHTPVAHKVAARLTFKNGAGEETHINYGTWDGEMTHYQQFRAGEKHRLLIYVRDRDVDVSLASFYEYNPFIRFRSGMTIHGPEACDLVADWNEVEIALLDGNATVFHGVFSWKADDNGFKRLYQQKTA